MPTLGLVIFLNCNQIKNESHRSTKIPELVQHQFNHIASLQDIELPFKPSPPPSHSGTKWNCLWYLKSKYFFVGLLPRSPTKRIDGLAAGHFTSNSLVTILIYVFEFSGIYLSEDVLLQLLPTITPARHRYIKMTISYKINRDGEKKHFCKMWVTPHPHFPYERVWCHKNFLTEIFPKFDLPQNILPQNILPQKTDPN